MLHDQVFTTIIRVESVYHYYQLNKNWSACISGIPITLSAKYYRTKHIEDRFLEMTVPINVFLIMTDQLFSVFQVPKKIFRL